MRSLTKRGWDLPRALTLLVLGAGCSHETTPARAAPPVTMAQVQERSLLPPLLSSEDFPAEVRLLHRVAACGGDEPLPPSADKGTVDEHCACLLPRLEAYPHTYLTAGTPF